MKTKVVVAEASWIDVRLNKIACDINGHYHDLRATPLVIAILEGGMYTAIELTKRMSIPLELRSVRVGRYGNAQIGGELEILDWPDMYMGGRHVLLIDDICDRGITLREVTNECYKRGALSVRTMVMADKHISKKRPDFAVVETPSRFLYGCGMDDHGLYRNCPHIFYLKD